MERQEVSMITATPVIGDIKVEVRKPTGVGSWHVMVFTFKENTLRGDSYWSLKQSRTFKRELDARKFAARFS